MARRTLHPLGETEMELLQHVWELDRATVGEVHQRVLETREVAYTTVMTVMKKLASKGYLAYTKEGNAYVYQAARPPEEVRTDLAPRAPPEGFWRLAPGAHPDACPSGASEQRRRGRHRPDRGQHPR